MFPPTFISFSLCLFFLMSTWLPFWPMCHLGVCG
jgi:hypothetical protein